VAAYQLTFGAALVARESPSLESAELYIGHRLVLFMKMIVLRWRLKTSFAQTSYLTLARGLATQEYGPEWRFTLYSQAQLGSTGLYCSAGYQFFKHTDSTLYPQSDTMSASLINSAPMIESSESHSFLIGAGYIPPMLKKRRFLPEFLVQLALPFSGKSIMSGSVLSAGVSCKF